MRTSPTAVRHLDDALAPVRSVTPLPPPAGGWVNAIRRALGMTERELAARMGVAQSSLHALERSEAAGTIRMATLRRAAEALDCEVLYALVPRRPLAEVVATRAEGRARDELERVRRTMSLEAQDVPLAEEDVAERAREIVASGRVWRE